MFRLMKDWDGINLKKSTRKTSVFSSIPVAKNVDTVVKRLEPYESFSINSIGNSNCTRLIYVLDGSAEYSLSEMKHRLNSQEYLLVQSLKTEMNIQAFTFVTLLVVFGQLSQNYSKLNVDSVIKITNDFESRDNQTFEHCRRVRDFALMIAEKIGLRGEQIASLAFAALFHDIGKASIPDEVLKKRTILTGNEFDILKEHPMSGSKMLDGVLPDNIKLIVEQHHERPDGSGYPYGLSGEEISIEAKIIGVADSYDAMTTDRPYHKAIAPEEAVQELMLLAGKRYEKDIVGALRQCLLEMEILS